MWSLLVDAKQNLKSFAECSARRSVGLAQVLKAENVFICSTCLKGNVSSIRLQRWACGTIDVCIPRESELFVLDMHFFKQLNAHASLKENNRSVISKSLLECFGFVYCRNILNISRNHGKALVSSLCNQ